MLYSMYIGDWVPSPEPHDDIIDRQENAVPSSKAEHPDLFQRIKYFP